MGLGTHFFESQNDEFLIILALVCWPMLTADDPEIAAVLSKRSTPVLRPTYRCRKCGNAKKAHICPVQDPLINDASVSTTSLSEASGGVHVLEMTEATTERHRCCCCALPLDKSEPHSKHRIRSAQMLDILIHGHWDGKSCPIKPKVGSYICCGHFLEGHEQIRKANGHKWLLPEMSDGFARENAISSPRETFSRRKREGSLKAGAGVAKKPRQHSVPLMSMDKREQMSSADRQSLLSRLSGWSSDTKRMLRGAKPDPKLAFNELMAVAQGAHGSVSLISPDTYLAAFEAGMAALPIEERSRPVLTWDDAADFMKACFEGFSALSRSSFTLLGVHAAGHLAYWTSVEDLATFNLLFVEPVLRWLKKPENRKHLPRSDYDLGDRIFWSVALIWQGMSYSELYRFVGDLYPPSERAFAQLIRTTIKAMAMANRHYISLPTVDEWVSRNTGAGMDNFPQLLFMFIDGTSWPLLTPGN